MPHPLAPIATLKCIAMDTIRDDWKICLPLPTKLVWSLSKPDDIVALSVAIQCVRRSLSLSRYRYHQASCSLAQSFFVCQIPYRTDCSSHWYSLGHYLQDPRRADWPSIEWLCSSTGRNWLQTTRYLAVDELAIHKMHKYATCVTDLGNEVQLKQEKRCRYKSKEEPLDTAKEQ